MKTGLPVTFRLLYFRYKAYMLSMLVFAVCIILILFFILPQINDYFVIREEEQKIREENLNLQSRLSILSSVSDSQVDEQTNLVKSALPIEKDFLGILESIASSARDAGIGLDDYSFVVGDVSTLSSRLNDSQGSSIPIVLKISGSLTSAKQFLSLLSKSIPLSSIEEITFNNGNTKAKVVFYHKLLSAGFSQNAQLARFTSKNLKTLADIKQWQEQNSNPFNLPEKDVATPSAQQPTETF